MKKKTKPAKNPVRRPLTDQEKEDARDVATMKRAMAKRSNGYSWNEFLKEMGRNDLVTPRRTRS